MASNLYTTIITWIDNCPDETINLILLTTDRNLLNGLIPKLLEQDKINKIILTNTIKMSDYDIKAGDRVIGTTEFNANQSRVYCFLDFNNTTSIMGNTNFSYSKKIEWDSLFRRNCLSIMTYKYSGNDILAGYWKMSSKDESIQIQILDLSGWGEMCLGIPKYEGISMGGKNVHSKELMANWIKSLGEFVEYIIRFLFRDDPMFNVENVVDFFKTDGAVETMIKAFTHSTQNAIYNYEALEHHGDNIFRTHFTTYLHTKFRRITNQESSGYVLRYLSKEFQHFWSDDLGLFDRVLKFYKVTPTLKVKTDAIEALMGGLAIVAYDLSPGFDFLLLNKMLVLLNDSIPFDKDMIFGKAKQKVVQIIEMSGFEAKSINIQSSSTESKTSTLLTVSVSKKLQDFFVKKDGNTINSSAQSNFLNTQSGLSSICTGEYKYVTTKVSKEAAENIVWERISKIFDENNFSFKNAYIRDVIFDTIQQYDQDTYNAFIEKLETYELTETNLNRIVFNKSLFENFIVVYILPTPNGEGYMTKKSMSRYKPNTRMIDDYEELYEGVIQNENLAVVEFPSVAESIGNLTDVTPLQYGKYQAILSFISS